MSSILFLSSDLVLRQKNIELLKQNGLGTTGAAGHVDDLLMINTNNIDLIVVDEELADMSGHEACRRLRQHSDIPIVLLGSITESEVWAKVEELGFDTYLRKPISPKELMARIRNLLRRPTLEKEGKEDLREKPFEAKSPAVLPTVVYSEPTRSSFVELKDEPATTEKLLKDRGIASIKRSRSSRPDVFISFATEDRETVSKIYDHLKSNGINPFWCKDMIGGEDYPLALADTIRSSKSFLLVISTFSDNSTDVRNETVIAAQSGKRIIPVRIEDICPKKLYYSISIYNFLDAFAQPIEQYLPEITKAIKKSIGSNSVRKGKTKK
jgi:DNA-binding response OmpR family regulator